MGRSSKGKSGEQYLPLPYAVLKSAAWRSLSGAAVKVLMELHTRFNGSNNGKVRLSMNEATQALGLGKATVQRAFVELEQKGFVALTAPGNWYHRRAHEWRLTMKPTNTPKGRQGPTNEWRSWSPEQSKKSKRGSVADPSPSVAVPTENLVPSNGFIAEPVGALAHEHLGSEMER